MNQEKIERINALYRKSKAEGLTEEEKKELTSKVSHYALIFVEYDENTPSTEENEYLTFKI